jgi:hypothetical protein
MADAHEPLQPSDDEIAVEIARFKAVVSRREVRQLWLVGLPCLLVGVFLVYGMTVLMHRYIAAFL